MFEIKDMKGVIPPIITPVDSSENVHEPGLRNVIDYVLKGGVHGVFVLGSNGEFYGLSLEEQKRAVEITVDAVAGRVPVYAGASAITTRECMQLARNAEDCGADALTVLTPMFIQPNEEEMYNHFKEIAASTKLPVLLYNNPGKTSNNISPGLLEKLADIENIVGIKNTSMDFSQTIKYLGVSRNNPSFRVFSGIDYYIYGTLAHGGIGCVAGTANVAPRLVSDIYDKYTAGDHQGAFEAQLKLLTLRDAYNYGTFPVVMKECLNMLGIDVGSPIKPVGHVDADQKVKIRTALKEIGLL